jgi:mannose-6-phosphate isomerase-like protein (cupin superfamily)
MNEETAKRSSIEAKQKTATENPGRRRALGTLGAFGAAAVTAHAPARAEEPNAPLELHRVVTGRDAMGKSVLASAGPSPRIVNFTTVPGLAFWEMYATQGTPPLSGQEDDPIPGLTRLVPQPGETRFFLIQFPPRAPEGWQPTAEWYEAAVREWEEKTPGFAFEKSQYWMHTTDTVDYDIVVRGEIILELDDGKTVHLRQGDCIVQNGTRHRWLNPLDQPCLMAVVMVGGMRKAG